MTGSLLRLKEEANPNASPTMEKAVVKIQNEG
jgi:hypothetical protein